MNNWGYLILIAALIALTAFMLYARFAARSREKSLHHAPFGSGVLRFEGGPDTDEGSPEELESVPDPVVMDLRPLRNDSDEEEAGKESSKNDDEYFDELQEAAAGLAMLMRSSSAQPASEPVVFEPQAEEVLEDDSPCSEEKSDISSLRSVEEEEALKSTSDSEKPVGEDFGEVAGTATGRLDSSAEQEPTSQEAPSISEAMDNVEALLDGPPVFDGEESAFEAEEDSRKEEALGLLLGGEVASQIAAIDSGLDELEALVGGIEDQLSLLEDFISAPVEEEISEAA